MLYDPLYLSFLKLFTVYIRNICSSYSCSEQPLFSTVPSRSFLYGFCSLLSLSPGPEMSVYLREKVPTWYSI